MADARELILKNDTATGELQVEGSIRQLRNLLKKHIIVKPACLFDTLINLDMKIMYASNGQYSDNHAKSLVFDLNQLMKQAKRQEFDHFIKYRFLYQAENGDIKPLYDKNQIVKGGAGDLLLTFSGHPNSGFEHCDVEIQSLTRGSQY